MIHLLKNIFGLSCVQFGNMIAPLLVIPFLSRVISPKEMGITLFSLSFVTWLSLFVEYGFSLSGSREVAQNNSNKRNIFSRVQTTKFFLSLLTILLGLAIGYTFPIYDNEKLFIIITVLLGVSVGINPIWFFQGEQKVLLPSIIDMLGTVLWIFVVFFGPIKNNLGFWVLVYLCIIKFFVYGLLSFFIFKKIGFYWGGVSAILDEIKKGFPLFLFKLAISLYTTGNIIILGYMVSPTQVGLFVAAERIAKAANNMLLPIVNALYPKISSLTHGGGEKIILINRISIVSMLAITLSFVCMVYFFGDKIIYFLLGNYSSEAFILLKIISLAVPIIAISNVLGFQCLIPNNLEKYVNRIMFFTGAINIILAILLTMRWQAIGMAWNLVIIEFFVVLQMVGLLLNKRVKM